MLSKAFKIKIDILNKKIVKLEYKNLLQNFIPTWFLNLQNFVHHKKNMYNYKNKISLNTNKKKQKFK